MMIRFPPEISPWWISGLMRLPRWRSVETTILLKQRNTFQLVGASDRVIMAVFCKKKQYLQHRLQLLIIDKG
jgi:hypothetical protein